MPSSRTRDSKASGLLTLILLLLLTATIAMDFPSTNHNSLDLKYERGKGEMEKLQKMMEASRLPHQQTCWKSSLEELHVSCKELSEEKQSRLAFAFTSCFTKMTGMGEYMCEESTDIKDCFRAFDPAVMHIFHSYFIHTQDMCFFLQHQVWQEQTDMVVNMLTSTTVEVAKSIQDSRDTQAEILESQKESVRVQSDLVKDQNNLYTNILGFKEVFDEFRDSANEHRIIFYEMFEKLSRMQKLVGWIQGEMSFFDTMAFYLMCLVFAFVATSTRRTHEARFWLVVLFAASLAGERYLFKVLAEDERNFAPEEIHWYIWFLRKVTASGGLCMVLLAAARYRDYNILNNNMLSHLTGRVDALYELVQELAKTDAKPTTILKELKSIQPHEHELPIGAAVEDLESSSSSSSEYSNYSEDSEPEMFEDEELKQEEKAPFSERLTNILRSPLTGSFFNTPVPNPDPSPNENESPIPSTSVYSTPLSAGTHRYNLRERRSVLKENDVVLSESATEFAKKVKEARRNSRTLFKTARASKMSCFSSDDEY